MRRAPVRVLDGVAKVYHLAGPVRVLKVAGFRSAVLARLFRSVLVKTFLTSPLYFCTHAFQRLFFSELGSGGSGLPEFVQALHQRTGHRIVCLSEWYPTL